jgi:8-oxo-dGTP pyrophosphatase MutT (NUDIX family)
MAFSFPVGDAADRARIEAVLDGSQPPAVPRFAATVAIIRDGDTGLEVYLMRRVSSMAFAAGMHVFPGGSVDPADYAGSATPEQALVNAAVREVREECDVRLESRDLVRIAHWITPELEPRRYDTHFFLAALPTGQECRDVGTEADVRVWVRPRRALDEPLTMLPPTIAVMSDLARFGDVGAAMAAERDIVTAMPVFALVGDRLELQLPAVSQD